MNRQRKKQTLKITIPNSNHDDLKRYTISPNSLKTLRTSPKILKDAKLQKTPKDGRAWIISKLKNNISDLDFTIELKTRSEEYSDILEDKLYSSLKYEMKIKVSHPTLLENHHVLVCKLQLKDDKETEKEILAGNLEFTCSKYPNHKNDSFEGFCKFNFTDVSLHHRGSENFNFQLSFFDPQFLEDSLVEIKSSGFKICARRQPLKKRKRGLDNFESRLDELVKCSKKLTNEEKKKGFQLISDKLINSIQTHTSVGVLEDHSVVGFNQHFGYSPFQAFQQNSNKTPSPFFDFLFDFGQEKYAGNVK
jgi:hypothetical protein